MKSREFQELVRDHYDRLFRAALFLCGQETAAEDLTQDTFLAAAESMQRFEARSSLYTWLYGIMLNKFRGWLRHKSRKRLSLEAMVEDDESLTSSGLLAAETPQPVDVAANREYASIVREILDELPEHHRGVLMLRFMEELSYEEIAQTLDCSIGTVKSRIHYGLRRIGVELAKRT